MKIISNKKITFIFSFAVLTLFFTRTIFAVWDGDFYAPGETLNPECLPDQPDCNVRPPLTSDAISDAAYGGLWDGDAAHAPSKNAVYDKIESIDAGLAIGDAITDSDSGSILFTEPAGTLSQNSTNFRWDDANHQLQIGPSAGFDGNSQIQLSMSNNIDGFSGIYNQNQNGGESASTDFIVGADNDGVDLTGHFGDFGIQSSGWSPIENPAYSGLLPNDVYLYGSGGNLILGTDGGVAGKVIKFFVGGLQTNNQEATITTTGLGIGTTNPGSALDVKGTLRLSGSSSGFVGFVPQSNAGSITYVLPNDDGDNDYVLTTDGNGNLSWSDKTGGVGGTISSINGDSSAAQTINTGDGLNINNSGATHTLSLDETYEPTWTGTHTFTDSVNSALFTGGAIGMGTITPTGYLSVTPPQYSTGTASQTLTTITGTGTTFTAAMVGSQLVFANGTSAGTITAFTDATHLTVSASQSVADQAYRISYTGLQVGNDGKVGISKTLPTSYLEINPGVALAVDSATANFLNVTGTLLSGNSAFQNGVNFDITSAGTGTQQRAMMVTLLAGYTGSLGTTAARYLNSAAGTGTSGLSGGVSVNAGVRGDAGANTAGHNAGGFFFAGNSSTLNIGTSGFAVNTGNSPLSNIGVYGRATGGSAFNAGGYFAIGGTPTPGTGNAALIADNGGTTSDIFVARDNGTPVFTVADGGGVTAVSLSSDTLSLTGTGTLNGLDAIDATGEATLEGVLDLQELQGAATDGQVPNNITIDLAATVTTNANLTGAITSTGNATVLGSFSSADLAGAVTGETGSGALVFATSPTLVTPVLGVATATSINKVAITSPATGSTLTIADGKTLTASNTLAFAGTDGSILNIGTGGTLGTAAYTAASAYEVPLTFSTGLTRTTNTITSNISTGVSGGQTIYGGSAADEDLTIEGTSHATKTTSYVNLQPTGGNVGIGDTSPASMFTVGSGDLFQVNSSGAIVASTGITTTGNVTLSGSFANILLGSNYLSGDGGDEGVFVNAAGQVGIATANPGKTLDIAGSSRILSTSGHGMTIWDGTTNLLNYQGLDLASTTYSFFGTNRTFTGSAWSSTGFYSARTAGSLQVENDSLKFFQFPAGSNTPGEVFRIASGGNVGIGTTSTGQRLTVLGGSGDTTVASISTSGGNSCTFSTVTGVFSCASDERLKNSIESIDAETALSKISNLNPVLFRYNWQNNSDPLVAGFIAQEFEDIFPEMVSTNETTGYKSLSYIPLIPYSIKAIQELDIKIGGVEERIGLLGDFEDSSIFADMWDAVAAKLASAANGIGDFFANRVRTKELCIRDSFGETCITKAQLEDLLSGANNSSSNSDGGSGSSGGGNNEEESGSEENNDVGGGEEATTEDEEATDDGEEIAEDGGSAEENEGEETQNEDGSGDGAEEESGEEGGEETPAPEAGE